MKYAPRAAALVLCVLAFVACSSTVPVYPTQFAAAKQQTDAQREKDFNECRAQSVVKVDDPNALGYTACGLHILSCGNAIDRAVLGDKTVDTAKVYACMQGRGYQGARP